MRKKARLASISRPSVVQTAIPIMACWNAAVSVSSTGIGFAPIVAASPLPTEDVSGMRHPPPRGLHLQVSRLRGHHGSRGPAAPSAPMSDRSSSSPVARQCGARMGNGVSMPGGTAAPYDLIVVGAGAAGSTAASEARGQGARVAMVEQWKVGGTCLNAGCDPTKALVRAAHALHETRTASRFGIKVEDVQVEWPRVIDRVERVIDTIRGGDGDRNIREAGIDLRKGHARLLSPTEIAVEGDVLRGEAVILATGVRAFIPAIPGLREVGFSTNVEAVTLPALPRSLAIIGGGTIAMEFAQIFARFGVKVTVLGRNPRLLPLEEPELVDILRELLAQEGVRIETGVTLECVSSRRDRKRIVAHRDGRRFEVETDEILVAAGRTPQVEDLGLETAGVVYDATGIVTDAAL